MNRTDLIHWYCLLRMQHSQYALSNPSHIIDKAREWVDKLLLLEKEPPKKKGKRRDEDRLLQK